MYKRQWHRKKLTKLDGEFILWHVIEHLRDSEAVWPFTDSHDAHRTCQRLLQTYFGLKSGE